MSNRIIEKLLNGAEVEWKPLGEVGELIRGNGLQKKDFTETGVPAIHYGQIYTYYGTFADKTKSFVSIEVAKKLKKAQKGDVLIAGTSENVEDVMKPLGWLGDEIVFSGDMFAFRPNSNLDTKYLTYLLQTERFTKYKEKYAQGTKVIRLNSVSFLKYEIPIPELKIQEKIVKTLDKFTELEATLEATLEAELALRKKQYQYYRETLLTFPQDLDRGYNEIAKALYHNTPVVFKALGEVAKIKNGKDWKILNSGSIPVYGSGGIMTYVDKYAYDKPTVLIPRKGTITNLFYLEEPFWNVDTIYYTEIDDKRIIPKFFYYFLKTIDFDKLDTGSGRPSLTQAILNEIKIPIPKLSEQQKIVNILDKFDSLTNSISEGLPKEIELRRKQYEYYREQLLDFPR